MARKPHKQGFRSSSRINTEFVNVALIICVKLSVQYFAPSVPLYLTGAFPAQTVPPVTIAKISPHICATSYKEYMNVE